MDTNKKDFTKVQFVAQITSDNQGVDVYKSNIFINITYLMLGLIFSTEHSDKKSPCLQCIYNLSEEEKIV